MRLKELTDLLRTHIHFGKVGDGEAYYATLVRVDVLDEGTRRAAVGFGKSKAKALTDLVNMLRRQEIEFKGGIGMHDVRLDLVRIKLKPGRVSEFT